MNPEFLMVLPTDITRVGPIGACVLALIRYATAIDGGGDGRANDAEGRVWWRASHGDMAKAIGVSHDTVFRTVSKLETASELSVFDPKDSSDRSFFYMVPEQSLRETASATTSHNVEARRPNAKSRRPNAESRSPLREIALCTIPLKNLKEVKEGKKGTRSRATLLADDWQPSSEAVAKLTGKYPLLDIEDEFEAFILWVRKKGTKYVDWTAGFQSWVRRAEKFRQEDENRNGNRYEDNDDKILNGWAVVGTNNTRKAIS